MVAILEPINAWVLFKDNQIQPYLFFWKNRQIKVDTINLVHTSHDGASVFYHFSISAGGNFYQLKFDAQKLNWFLEKVEEG